MQILLTLKPNKPLNIPFNYNYQLQSAILAKLKETDNSDFWHRNGGYCFGKLEGRHVIDRMNKRIIFENNVSLEIRSNYFEFIDSFQRSVEQHPYIKLFDTEIEIVGAALINRHLTNGNQVVDIATPAVVSTTLNDKHTYYFSPEEEEFFTLICNNVEKSYENYCGILPDKVIIRPAGNFKKTVTSYKGTLITGYSGKVELKTTLKMAEFIYNSGLGARKSEGFGFVKIIEGSNRK